MAALGRTARGRRRSVEADTIVLCLADSAALAHAHALAACPLSLQCYSAPCAAVSIWAAHQEWWGLALENVNVAQEESAWIFRSDLT